MDKMQTLTEQNKAEIIVEVHRYTPPTSSYDSKFEALWEAATMAYLTIHSGLMYEFLGTSNHKHTEPDFLPCQYWKGIGWIPWSEGVIWTPPIRKEWKFKIKALVERKKDGNYTPLVDLEAFIFNKRFGILPEHIKCLYNVVHRNSKYLKTEAHTGRLQIDTRGYKPRNPKGYSPELIIRGSNLVDVGGGEKHLVILFPDPETGKNVNFFSPYRGKKWNGDITHRRIDFKPVNLMYRMGVSNFIRKEELRKKNTLDYYLEKD